MHNSRANGRGSPEANIILGDFVKSGGSIHSVLQRKLTASVLNETVHKHTHVTPIAFAFIMYDSHVEKWVLVQHRLNE